MEKKPPYERKERKERKGKKDRSVYQALALVTQFGINMLVPIGIMSWLGIWLDRKCGTSFFMVLFFFIGAAAGFQNIWRMARAVYDDGPGEKKPKEKKPRGKKPGEREPKGREDAP